MCFSVFSTIISFPVGSIDSKIHRSDSFIMEENRLLGEKGEPAPEDGQPFPSLPCHRNYRPGSRETLIFGAMLLMLSAAGNVFQYWHYHQVATDSDRSRIGKSKTLFSIM